MSLSKDRSSTFKSEWINLLDAGKWLSSGSSSTMARCKLCNCELSVSKGGIQVIKSHMTTVKHKVGNQYRTGRNLYYRRF